MIRDVTKPARPSRAAPVRRSPHRRGTNLGANVLTLGMRVRLETAPTGGCGKTHGGCARIAADIR